MMKTISGIVAAIAMSGVLALGGCGGGADCDAAAKNVAKIMYPDDQAKRDEQYKDGLEECKKQGFTDEAIKCAAAAKDLAALQKCPRDRKK